jgi:hypothetical protein
MAIGMIMCLCTMPCVFQWMAVNMLACTLQCVPCIIYGGHWYEHVFVHDAIRVSIVGMNMPTCTWQCIPAYIEMETGMNESWCTAPCAHRTRCTGMSTWMCSVPRAWYLDSKLWECDGVVINCHLLILLVAPFRGKFRGKVALCH